MRSNKELFTLIIGGKGRAPDSDYTTAVVRMRRGESTPEEILDVIMKNSDRLTPETALLWGGSFVAHAYEILRQKKTLHVQQVQDQQQPHGRSIASDFQEALQMSALGDNRGIRVVVDSFSNHFFFQGRALQFSGKDGYLECYEKGILLSRVSGAIPDGVAFVPPQAT